MTTTSGNINSTSLIVQAFLNIVQDTSQGVISQQSIDINCEKNTQACINCIKTAKKYELATDDYSSICPSCFCTLENVKINNYITVNLSSFMDTKSSQAFVTQLSNALTQQALITGSKLFKTDDGLKALNKNAEDIYKEMKTSSIQTSLQELKNFQVISINNPNSAAINVDLSVAIDFISKIIQNSENMSSQLENLETTILTLTTKQIQDFSTVLVTWMVTLFLIAIIIVFFIFCINIVMNVLTLYAST